MTSQYGHGQGGDSAFWELDGSPWICGPDTVDALAGGSSDWDRADHHQPAATTAGKHVGQHPALFSGAEAVHGREIWATDGRTAHLLKDIAPGPRSSTPTDLTTVDRTTFFTADDGTHGIELWKTNGTATGTSMVKDIQPPDAVNPPRQLTAARHTLFFTADDGTHGTELWKSDGTSNGTRMVADIRSGPAGSFPSSLTAVGKEVYFSANDGVHGVALWKSDGTSAGTTLVKDFVPGSFDPPIPFNQAPEHLTAVGNTLFLTARQGGQPTSLWKTDGTEAGTALLKSGMFDNPRAGFVTNLEAAGNRLFFNSQFALWTSDGTVAGTKEVKAFASVPETNPTDLTAVGNDLFFVANDGTHGMELWFSDGTSSGTHLVKDINPGSPDSARTAISDLTVVGKELFFTADDGKHGLDLWMSNGTDAGTHRVKDVVSNAMWSSPADLSAVNGQLFFSAADLQGDRKLFSLDPGSTQVARIPNADPLHPSYDPTSFVPAPLPHLGT